MDAGAPDGWLIGAETAKYLQQADIGQATGFFVNATHNDWTTTDVHFGQQIARITGGKHFIVQTDDNGRGPLIPTGPQGQRQRGALQPSGRGTGPLSRNTGYKYVDGFLWFNNPGNSDGPCGVGDRPCQFWAPYAVGLVQHGTQKVTGPHFNLLTSNIDLSGSDWRGGPGLSARSGRVPLVFVGPRRDTNTVLSAAPRLIASMSERCVAHLDMDAFYVSVELRRRPELRGKPVIVAGRVRAQSLPRPRMRHARFGVGSAIPASQARRLCPQAVSCRRTSRITAPPPRR